MKTGRAIAAHIGLRISKLLSATIERRATLEDWIGLKNEDSGLTAVQRRALRAWTNRRRHLYCNHPRQARLVLATPFEEDIMVATIGVDAALRETTEVEAIMQEFVIPLSDKPQCNAPFDEFFTALGATFDARTNPPSCKPSEDKLDSFATRIDEMKEHKGRTVLLRTMKKVAGHIEDLARFTRDSLLRAQEVYICVEVGSCSELHRRPVTQRIFAHMEKLLVDVRRGPGMLWIRNPFYKHPGAYGFTMDACAPSSNALSG